MDNKQQSHPIERLTTWIGSVSSLLTHTLIFSGSFILCITGVVSWNFMLLVLTTILSLEAIYLAIFIQMTVNRQAQSLREVEADVDEIQADVEEIQEDVGEIQGDVDEIQEDVEEIQDDVEEIQEDVEEITEDEVPASASTENSALEKLTRDVHKILADLEELKKEK